MLDSQNEKVGSDAGKTHQDARHCDFQAAGGIGASRVDLRWVSALEAVLERFRRGTFYRKNFTPEQSQRKSVLFLAP